MTLEDNLLEYFKIAEGWLVFHQSSLYYMSPSSQDETLYYRVLIMDTSLSGTAALQAEMIPFVDLNLGEPSQQPHF